MTALLTPHTTLRIGEITYSRHPLSAIFPAMSAHEYETLKSSIRSMGLKRSVLKNSENEILDGWHRLSACIDEGVNPTFETVEAGADLISTVVALNLAQRHLNVAQRALIAAELASFNLGGTRPDAGRHAPAPGSAGTDDSLSLHLVAADAGAQQDPATQKNQRSILTSDSFDAGSGGNPDEGIAIPRISLQAAADSLGISRTSAMMARRVQADGSQDVLQAVRNNEISLKDAYDVSRAPEEDRSSLFQMRIDEGKDAMKRAKKGGNQIAKLAKQIRALKVPPPGATPDEVDSAYFVIGNDTANAIELIVVLLRRDANCINDQALIMMISSFGNLNRTLQELRPSVLERAKALAAEMEES